ncbi:46374_t:CDS:2 [Gigaspora margarita]|uniref:46374_t:CDS:1 n=1 Tax=Gigaspora margarita TaxID=4874 RepID=A0ABN7UF78_GIGMA|nr:46374_t:CDS:2 [Gigaspora margarita]
MFAILIKEKGHLINSTRKPLRNLETSNKNIQEFVANKVATGSNSVELVNYSLMDMLSDM